jgi:Family of unknown function (DUF6529)
VTSITGPWLSFLHGYPADEGVARSAFDGAVVTKVLIVRSTRFAPWVLPVAGGLLFSILLGLWLTSALWFFAAAPS